LQEINKEETKKIVTIEDPIEYVHKSDKCVVIQKEVGLESDVRSYYDGLINLLREDADITVIGEIRDRKTMDVAIDLAESGGLVIGTLHTRSCGETVDRIVNMYEPSEQMMVKSSISSVLKLVVSQKLVVGTNNNLILVPEIMMVNSTIAAQIRQEKFSISDIEDAIHSLRDMGCLSYEYSFADLFSKNLVDMKTIKENVDLARLDIIKGLIVNIGGIVEQ
jgi:twitching motility protein PilT